jgi:cytidine deaminase
MNSQYLKLLSEAKKARKSAYCPYSKFSVGAAVLAGNNKIYSGANVENASYGLSCCAERVAVFKAVADGQHKIKAVAIDCGKKAIEPCGACRQVIIEFGANADIVTSEKNKINVIKLSKLLPGAFGKKNLL